MLHRKEHMPTCIKKEKVEKISPFQLWQKLLFFLHAAKWAFYSNALIIFISWLINSVDNIILFL